VVNAQHPFWEEVAPLLGIDPASEHPLEAAEDRARTKAEIDVLVARDLFGLSDMEMNYVLDPTDIVGEDCGFETFGALKRAEIHEFGRFATKDLILKIWRELATPSEPVPSSGIDPRAKPRYVEKVK
jgi:hypothetical protein